MDLEEINELERLAKEKILDWRQSLAGAKLLKAKHLYGEGEYLKAFSLLRESRRILLGLQDCGRNVRGDINEVDELFRKWATEMRGLGIILLPDMRMYVCLSY